jgi:hypothetical protein
MSKFKPAEATVYLQVELRRKSQYGASEAVVVRQTQRKPDRVAPDCIVTKVKLRIPVEGWDAFEPEAVIDVPADLIQHPIVVEAEDAES